MRFIPRLREIDEQREAAIYAQKYSTEAAVAKEKKGVDTPTLEEVPGSEWEVRDEANRKWYRALFDDKEYKRKPKEGVRAGWFHWFQSNDTAEERKLITKLDLLVCFYAFAMYWVKFLDQSNLNNAYVSGMKEELDMKGDDLIHTQIMYTVGSVVFQIPFMYIVHRYPCHYLLPIMDIGWGLFTLAIYRAKSVGELQAYRFFVGVFEAAFYPTSHYLFGSWYRPSEYNRRGGFFYFGQMLGLLTSGLIQSSAFRNLSGVNGLSGWRWLFVIDAIITVPIGLMGFFIIPGTPKNCYSLWLTDQEIYLGRKRMREANIALESHAPNFFDRKLWKKVLSNWRIYMFTLVCIFFWNNSNANYGAYVLWLKSLKKYSIPTVNQYSTITPALGFVWITLAAFISDQLNTRVGTVYFTQSLNVLGNVLLAVWHLPQGVLWFAFCLQYLSWSVATSLYGWCSDATRDDPQIRVISVIVMNMVGQSSTAITSAFVWKTVDAPRFLKGYSFAAANSFAMILMTIPLTILFKRDERKMAYNNGILLYNSAKGESPPIPPTTSELSDCGSIEKVSEDVHDKD